MGCTKVGLLFLVLLGCIGYAYAQDDQEQTAVWSMDTTNLESDITADRADSAITADTADVVSSDDNSAIEANNKLCPFDLVKISQDNKFQYNYKSKIYNFHSLSCINKFKVDPDKYLKDWEEEERRNKVIMVYD